MVFFFKSFPDGPIPRTLRMDLTEVRFLLLAFDLLEINPKVPAVSVNGDAATSHCVFGEDKNSFEYLIAADDLVVGSNQIEISTDGVVYQSTNVVLGDLIAQHHHFSIQDQGTLPFGCSFSLPEPIPVRAFLGIDHSDPALPTVTANGQPVRFAREDPPASGIVPCEYMIPADLMKQGVNQVQFQSPAPYSCSPIDLESIISIELTIHVNRVLTADKAATSEYIGKFDWHHGQPPQITGLKKILPGEGHGAREVVNELWMDALGVVHLAVGDIVGWMVLTDDPQSWAVVFETYGWLRTESSMDVEFSAGVISGDFFFKQAIQKGGVIQTIFCFQLTALKDVSVNGQVYQEGSTVHLVWDPGNQVDAQHKPGGGAWTKPPDGSVPKDILTFRVL